MVTECDVSVLKLFHFFGCFGFGIEKKYWIRYRKKYWIRYRKNLVSEKSFGYGFVQILGIVTHWMVIMLLMMMLMMAVMKVMMMVRC